ncbi:N-acetyltransferase eso1 [Sporothrix eucalyptigena]|uniref:N-acetyltransferase eso1 n=1 Tax=Sporothrix eucalyptigena TaxID=1812306 RepID=A0ABP0BFW8_9PEZI
MTPTGLPPAQSPAASPRLDDAISDSPLLDVDIHTDPDRPPSHGNDADTSNPSRRTSRFTYRQLADLAAAAPTCPLRVIAHIDLDAYYAQCEMRRLGTADDTPLVVQQWRNIIAVNYPARAFGISRMITAVEAKRLCPDLILQHVPTWKEGESQWAYHEEAHNAMAQHKVSLEPYRIRSREILATIKESLPGRGAETCKIEKAGIDEVFVDLSAHVHGLIVNKLYSEVLADYREHYQDLPTKALPLPPVTEADLDWAATGSNVIDDQGGDKDSHRMEEDADRRDGSVHEDIRGNGNERAIDWDDIVMLEGARIIRAVRQALYDKLQFRCSAGIATNKMLSKLGSSQHKPDKQTIVRPRAVEAFMGGLSSVTKLRGLGGKMGARVVAVFDTESIAELRTVTLAQMQAKLDDQETGFHIYGMVRGVDRSEVTARTEIKSIISAKSFQPPLKSMDQALRWLRVFAAELKCRLLDEKLSQALLAAATVSTTDRSTSADTENSDTDTKQAPDDNSDVKPAAPLTAYRQNHNQQLRLPQTIRLHYGGGTGSSGHWRSRQTRIPRDGTPLDEEKLMRLGTQLLDQTQRADSLWPCAHLAISVDGFEEPVKGNKSIESFFQKATTPTTTSPQTASLPKTADDDENDFDGNSLDDTRSADDDDQDNDTDGMPLTKRRRTEMLDTTRKQTVSTEEESRTRNHQSRAEPVKPVDERPGATSKGGSKPAVATAAVAASASAFFKPKDGSSNVLSIGHGNANSASAHANSGLYTCGRCSKSFIDAVQLQEHEDWHVARKLQAQEKIVLAPPSSSTPGTPTPSTAAITATATRRRGHVPVNKRAAPTPPANSISSFFQNRARSPPKNEDSSASSNNNTNNNGNDNAKNNASNNGMHGAQLACSRCGNIFDHPDGLQVHEDWHFAKDLETG